MTREEAITELNTFKIGAKSELGKNALDMAIKALEQETRKGHWIEHEKSISTGFRHLRECSCCKCYFDWLMPRNSFCPNCGADMREVEE